MDVKTITGKKMRDQFKRTNPIINAFAQQNADNLYHVACCVQITIQQDTSNLDLLCTMFKKHGANIPVLKNMASKRKSCEYFYKNRHQIYGKMMSIIKSKKADIPNKIMALFLDVPNLGVAKASFLGQLAVGHKGLACFDSVNIKKYGIDQSVVSAVPKNMSRAGKDKKIQNYVDTVYRLGGSETLWNQWCDQIYVNRLDKKESRQFKSGLDVSLKHAHWFTTWSNRYEAKLT
tara:strand:- start:259 stop:957 length:699 start_codon:yes stop_codon:yes gene_type:complete